MTISRVCYSNRTDVQLSIDFKPGLDVNAALDRALTTAADNIDGQFHRVFFPSDDTRYFDWPNQGGSGGGQYAQPWRLYLDDNDLTVLTSLVTGGVTITLDQVFAEPVNNPQKGKPFYTYIELDRSTSAAFGGNAQTPQHSIVLAGTWGYGADADPAGQLAADAGTGDTVVTTTDGSAIGPGDLMILGYGRGTAPYPAAAGHAGAIAPYTGERCLVTGVSAVSAGLTQSGSGVTTASNADNALSTTGGGALNAGEVIVLDQEDCLVEQIVDGVATVRRAWNGTALAEHSGATVYAFRLFSVLRAQLGTSASSYTTGAAVYRHRIPPLIRDLSIAESAGQLLQEGSGYARTVGSGEAAHPAPGIALADKWSEARTRHGRKARHRGV
ncbi:MAG: hypothetical protein ACRDRJ_09210 [Streptosporangiaceae bacterium]